MIKKMNAVSDSDMAGYWAGIVSWLVRELETADDPQVVSSLRHALFRVLFDRQDRAREAAQQIDAALQIEIQSADIVWDALRASTGRDSRTQVEALEKLILFLDRPKDIVACHLDIAHMRQRLLDDLQGARICLEAARLADPENRGILWRDLIDALASDDDPGVLSCLKAMAQKTTDPVWKSTLLVEQIAVRRRMGDGAQELSELLLHILDLPDPCWTSVNEVFRVSGELDSWDVHVRALEIMARVALEPILAPVSGRPDGHVFDGFGRGERYAAGFYWLLSIVKERRINDLDGAFEALNHAFELFPDNNFLAMERARLLQVMGRFTEALDAIPYGASDVWKAEIALASDRKDLVADFIREVARIGSSLLYGVLVEVAGEGKGRTEADVDPRDPARWLLANPAHPKAPDVAAELIESDKYLPVAGLIVQESMDPGAQWPTDEDRQFSESWARVLDAVTGPGRCESSAYLDWADTVESPDFEADLTAIAALAAEDKGDLERALQLCANARENLPDSSGVDRQVARLLRRMGKWRDLVEHLAVVSAESEDQDNRVAALHERSMVLEFVLKEPAAVIDSLQEIISQDPENVPVLWSMVRVATRLLDWNQVLGHLQSIAQVMPDERGRLDLLCGEIHLFALGGSDDAIAYLQSAKGSLSGPLCRTAQLYLDLAYHDKGDVQLLVQLLEEQLSQGDVGLADLWFCELLESSRATSGNAVLAQILDNDQIPEAIGKLWSVILGDDSGRPSGAQESFVALTSVSGAMAGACKIASVLMDKDMNAAGKLEETDLDTPEALWLVADRLSDDADPDHRIGIYGKCVALTQGEDLDEWADWILCLAQAYEDKEDLEAAVSSLKKGLEKHPDHPGLIESLARVAFDAKRFEDSADAHKKLAGYYTSPQEKATQLARAATIMFTHLDDPKGAEVVAREAVKRSANHDAAHEILTVILREQRDDDALVQQIGERIGAEQDVDTLVALYEEQADRFFAVDDMEGALDAVEKILDLKPDHLTSYRTKIDLLLGTKEFEDAVATMMEFTFICQDLEEKRTMVWRAADVLVDDQDDPQQAIEVLTDLLKEGDRHPQTERHIARIAGDQGMWDEATQALTRLARMVTDPEKRAEILTEQASILIEKMFDPDAASEVIDMALQANPSSVDAIKLTLELRDESDAQRVLHIAQENLIRKLDENPVDLKSITDLKEISSLLGKKNQAAICSEGIVALSGSPKELGVSPAYAPVKYPDPSEVMKILRHDGERGQPVADIALIAAPVTAEVYSRSGHFPDFGRSTLVRKKGADPVLGWLLQWATLLGVKKFEVHRVGHDPRGSRPLPTSIPAVAVNSDFSDLDLISARFFIARNFWRSMFGLGTFEEGDTATPIRWFLALTAATLGEDVNLPVPTDMDLVVKARKALSRKIRKELVAPCTALLSCSAMEIRTWVASTSFSADRFGLLAAGDLSEVIPLMVEESAGPPGLRRLAENASDALSKVPRCTELMRFALCGPYLETRRIIGLSEVNNSG